MGEILVFGDRLFDDRTVAVKIVYSRAVIFSLGKQFAAQVDKR